MPKAGQFSLCTEDGCDSRMLARGFCSLHYGRRRQAGLIKPLPPIPVPERFWAKVDKNGPVSAYRPSLGQCWIWKPEPAKSGYGTFAAPGVRGKLAHRYSYHLNVGPIPAGLHIDHLCRNRRCVRPTHLEAVTQQENNRRQWEAANITHCPAGHAYEGDNLYIDRRGGRRCRKCAVLSSISKRNAVVVRVRFHGHYPEYVAPGDWRCRCGEPLAGSKREAIVAMRERHAAELRTRVPVAA